MRRCGGDAHWKGRYGLRSLRGSVLRADCSKPAKPPLRSLRVDAGTEQLPWQRFAVSPIARPVHENSRSPAADALFERKCEEERIAHQVTLGEPPRFLRQPECPLQACFAQQQRC